MAATEGPSVENQKAGAMAAPNIPDPVEGTTENASLYVGDLDKEVQETHLFELFSEHGPVHSIRVCRDTVTRRSLGYAYVNFNVAVDADAAKNAKEKLNYHVLNGKAIRIMWANRNARTRTDKSGNIFIKNLEKSITTRVLHDTFADFGEILSCKVATDKDGNSKGYGFVHFSDPDAAKKAIEDVNGAQLGDSDKVVTVTEFISKQDRGDVKQNFTNVYVKNLPNSLQSEDDVRALFKEFGTISSAACMKDEACGKYFAFVNYETHEAAQAAVKEMHEKELEGAKLYVDRAQTKAERQGFLQRRYEQKRTQMAHQMEGKNVYVKNLAPVVDEEKLKAAFSKFGEISSVKVMRDPDTKKSRGFGFVCFNESSSAQDAVSQMATAMLEGKQLYVAFAQPKAIRAQQLQAAINMNLGSGKGNHVKGPGMPAFWRNELGYPAMMPFPGRGMVPGMYPQMGQQMQQIQQLQQGGTRGNQNVPNGNANGFTPMMAPGMMAPMMNMGPGMMHMNMAGMGGRGGRQGGRGGRGGPGRGAVRPSARGPMPRPEQHMRSAAAEPQGEESLAGRLANMPDDERKQHLGEMLFPRLRSMLLQRYNNEDVAEKLASKVTGMMLEMPAQTVLYLLETVEELTVKLDEALVVLRDHGAMPEGIPAI